MQQRVQFALRPCFNNEPTARQLRQAPHVMWSLISSCGCQFASSWMLPSGRRQLLCVTKCDLINFASRKECSQPGCMWCRYWLQFCIWLLKRMALLQQSAPLLKAARQAGRLTVCGGSGVLQYTLIVENCCHASATLTSLRLNITTIQRQCMTEQLSSSCLLPAPRNLSQLTSASCNLGYNHTPPLGRS